MDANSIQQHQKELCQKLWAMANALRGNMEAYEFKKRCRLPWFLKARKPQFRILFETVT